jgi:hypothetical protein
MSASARERAIALHARFWAVRGNLVHRHENATRSCAYSGQAAGEDEPLLPAAQREPAVEHERRLLSDPVEQHAVLSRHREHRRGAAAVEERDEVEAAVEPLEPALRLEGDQQVDGTFEPAVDGHDAETLEVVARQVDAPVRHVLGDIPKHVPDLERNTEVVGKHGAAYAVRAVEDAERQAADRACDTAAVPLELGERFVRGSMRIHLRAVDQVAERLERDREPRSRIGHRDEHRLDALADPTELAARVLEGRELLVVSEVAVRDVVDLPRECIHGEQRRTAVGRQQPHPRVEARAGRARNPPAVLVGELTHRPLTNVFNVATARDIFDALLLPAASAANAARPPPT